MSRLPLLRYDDADDEQRKLWDEIEASRGGALDLSTPEGRLAGPFEAFVRRPALGQHLIKVGGVIRFESSLPTPLLEIAICTVGAHWKSEFEFWAHSKLALEAGVAPGVLESLAGGLPPEFGDDSERAIYDYTTMLVTTGHVDQATYDNAADAVGVDGVIDLTHTIGYYCQISFILNAFDVALPVDAKSAWK